MSYDNETKAARMRATRDRLNAGFLDGLSAVGTVLVSWPLEAVSGAVEGPVLTLAGFPKIATAAGASTQQAPIASARLRTATGVIVKGGLSVGLSGAVLNISQLTWQAGDEIAINQAPTLVHGV